jgi:hypothetical protein
MRTKQLLLFAVLGIAVKATKAFQYNTSIDIDHLEKVIHQAQENSWAELKDHNWNFPTYLGTWFLSEYWFELQALGLSHKSQFNETIFT